MTEAAAKRALAAERARRHRERNRLPWRRRIVLSVEVTEHAFVEACLDAGKIGVANSECRDALAAVAGQILAEWQFSVTRDASQPIAWGILRMKNERTADEDD